MTSGQDLTDLVNGYAEHEHLAIRQDVYKRFNQPRDLNLFEWVIDRLSLNSGQRVLDLGCGNGAFHPSLLARGAEIVSLDYSPAIVGFLRQSDASSKSKIVCASADAIPLKSHSCDAAIANFMLHYFDPAARQSVLREIKRVVRPGGAVVSANFAPDLVTRLRGLHHEAAEATGFEADTSDFHIFNMASLADWHLVFPDVRTEMLSSKFVVTEAHPLLKYYSSFLLDKVRDKTSDNAHRLPMIAWMADQIEAIIAKEGAFEDPTSAGAFIATA